VTHAERPELRELAPAAEDVWPEYNLHGDDMNRWWRPLLEELRQYQFCLVDSDSGAIVAEGHTGPLAWSGEDRDLPPSIDDAIERVIRASRAGEPVDTLCAFAAEVAPAGRQRGLAGEVLKGMSSLAGRNGLRRVIAPVRPSWKERYPLTPIERYATWRREDGQLLDPWMRLHERLGARVATSMPRSLRISGTVGDWESWTGMAFPESGDYVFPHGLAPLSVDREADVGAYWEPNIWMVHPEL
jgi:hypothetical protein